MTSSILVACAGMSTSVGIWGYAGHTKSCWSVHRAMACFLLIVLHLAYTSLATVRSSIMPYGTDGSIFVEQHPHLYQVSNSTCEEYVYSQAGVFAKFEFSRITSTIRTISKMFVGNVLHSSKDAPSMGENILSATSLMDDYIRFLQVQDSRIQEITFTVNLKSKNYGAKNKSDVILFLKSEHFNTSWQTHRNWERICKSNYSSQTGLNFDTSVHCSTKARETLLMNNDDLGSSKNGNSHTGSHDSPTSTAGYWNVYCSRPNSPSTVDSVLFIYEIVDTDSANATKNIPELLR